MSISTHIVVIGNGMVGHHFVEEVMKLQDDAKVAKITVICGEPNLAYDRVHLSEYFSDKTAEDLAMTTHDIYDQWGVDVLTSTLATHIDITARTVTTNTDIILTYDHLVIATGSYPFVPPVPGHQQVHCLVYRTLEDLEAIQESAQQSKVGVVVGGGLLGLEAANALKNLGLETHIVEFAPQCMGVQLDPAGGRVLRDKIEALGVRVHTGCVTEMIEAGDKCRYKMQFADGRQLETDMILFSAGIRPYDQLARDAHLQLGERGGIAIDSACKTSVPNVYAIGECASLNHFIYGLVAPGYAMAKVAARHILQTDLGNAKFSGADMSTKLKLLGVEVGSIGDAHGKTAGSQAYIYENQPLGIYKKMVVSEDRKQLLGAVLVGDTSEYDTLLQYKLNRIVLEDTPEVLILPAAHSKPDLGADALPNSAVICSCHNVTKADIISAMDDGAMTHGDVKSCTKASTGCGGCAALLKSVVDSEMANRGVAVSNDICEHFAYSRQELYDIVRIKQIRTFDELLAKYGKGLGCDICKPAVASILSSVWNDYVLSPDNVGLQDTNDTYLANMQKDGTYSVVPRIPGGEITPDKLIAIGSVAKRYKLYTKITGGQRIDLFGARVEQLPHIWSELIDAGLETGHAYGKALRTVKSCVGSTWCRYGVQDSVAMAIFLENRYKGLRAPHKIKFAVSGCTRECAEAQSKDIGVIATDKGWNLYVCGNGGMKPRHGDLFATDLDDVTLIKYIDRVLMFYVKTADRLQRTSVWMENMEGGLDYLQHVVIRDALGLGEQLESHMQAVVDTYRCEWKATLENPESLKRFRQFVNSKKTDSNIQFVDERGQIRPAREAEKQGNIAIKELL